MYDLTDMYLETKYTYARAYIYIYIYIISKGHRLRVYKNSLLRKFSGSKREKTREDWRKSRKETFTI